VARFAVWAGDGRLRICAGADCAKRGTLAQPGKSRLFCDRSTLLDALAEVVLTGAGMLQEILTALCLVLVIEGILPFLMPARWQRMLGGIVELGVRQIRLAGLASMLIGTLCLYLVR